MIQGNIRYKNNSRKLTASNLHKLSLSVSVMTGGREPIVKYQVNLPIMFVSLNGKGHFMRE